MKRFLLQSAGCIALFVVLCGILAGCQDPVARSPYPSDIVKWWGHSALLSPIVTPWSLPNRDTGTRPGIGELSAIGAFVFQWY